MSRGEYRFRFYLNARHKVKFGNSESKIHPHTWEIILHVLKDSALLEQFSIIENEINNLLSRYEGRYLNEISPFDSVNPSMESLGEYISDRASKLLEQKGWHMLRLEISENPARTYIISNNEVSSNETLQFYRQLAEFDMDQAAAAAEDSQARSINLQCADESAEPVEVKTVEEAVKAPVELVRKHFPSRPYLAISLAVVLTLTALLYFWITRKGVYPWASDIWGHLFKADLLYKEVLSGNPYPLFTDLWYNGVQPFRYWGPVAHYIIFVFEICTNGNVVTAYNVFLLFIFVFGAFGWVLWGIGTKRYALALVLAPLWFLLPDNLRVLFSEGNISRALVTVLFPYLLFCIWHYFESGSKKTLLLIPALMAVMTVSHTMITAMVGITIFIYALLYGRATYKLRRAFEITGMAVSGIAVAGVWLYPALKGGIVSLDQTAMGELMKSVSFPMLQSLNPFLRLGNIEIFYFGISVIIISIIGLLFGGKKSKAGFLVAILIFLGTTMELLPLLVKIPFSYLFWMMRFTPLAMGVFFVGLLLWKEIKKGVLIALMLLLIADSALSFVLLCYDGGSPVERQNILDQAVSISTQKIAMIDKSEFGSFPSYYISNNKEGKSLQQVFGWTWQEAKTAPNIVGINTAVEKGYYGFLCDRCLELGADTLVVKKDVIGDLDEFVKEAQQVGYEKKAETETGLILKYPVDYPFATKVSYKGIGIGKYASNMAFIFPEFETGSSIYLDDYGEAMLSKYKTVYLSGFKYRDKAKAESMVKALSEKGVRFVIDLTGAESDLYSSTESFLGVMAQPVLFKGNYPAGRSGISDISPGQFPAEYSDWRTFYMENLDYIQGSIEFQDQEMDFLGTKINGNIDFIGFNIPFFAMETGDANATKILENATGFKENETPHREMVRLDVTVDKNTIEMKAAKEGVLTWVAGLDSFETLDGTYQQRENLVYMNGKELKLKVKYPYLPQGIVMSLIGLAGVILIYGFTRKGGKTV